MNRTFYDLNGNPISYTENDDLLFLFEGKPVGYIDEDAVFSIKGHHLGWYENGWIRDCRGRRVFYTESADDKGPIPPAKKAKPSKGKKQKIKDKGAQHSKSVKPPKSSSWSAWSGEMYFFQ